MFPVGVWNNYSVVKMTNVSYVQKLQLIVSFQISHEFEKECHRHLKRNILLAKMTVSRVNTCVKGAQIRWIY